jgi:hypothetical protein
MAVARRVPADVETESCQSLNAAAGLDYQRSEHDRLHGPNDGVNDERQVERWLNLRLTDCQQGLDLGNLIGAEEQACCVRVSQPPPKRVGRRS